MLQLLTAARSVGVRVFYAMHHRYRPGDYETWKYIAPIQKAAWSRKTFEYGTWGGEFRTEFAPQPGDIVAREHWGSSGFANTDLDLQLKKHGIHKLIVIGLLAHTCLESRVRYGMELGYDVTVVRDATASFTDEQMHAALEVNLPNYATAIVTTEEALESLSSLKTLERSHQMPNEKVVRLLQVKVLPQYRDEVLQAVRANKLPTRADKGVEVYYQTTRKDDPNTLLFFAVFESQDAYDSHLRQEHAKRTYAAFQGRLAEEPVRTELVELE